MGGLNELWQRRRAQGQVMSAKPSPPSGASLTDKGAKPDAQPTREALEMQVAEVGLAVARSSLPGLEPRQLLACAELCAAVGPLGFSHASKDVLEDVVQEAVRKLSGFKPHQLQKLREAALELGEVDPYLERARRRRFPKALRKALRDAEAAPAPATAEATSQDAGA